MPAAESVAASVSPGSASSAWPSKRMRIGEAAGRMSGWVSRMRLPVSADWGSTRSHHRTHHRRGKRRGEPFRGTYTVLITPFTADGAAVDLKALKRLVEFQIAEGIHGLIPLGSTGEFLSVSREERTAIAETVVQTAAGRVPVLIGTGAEDTREVVALSKEAEALGADGVMIIPPFYSVPTEDELFHHYKTVAEAIGIPIMVYNNPATANVDLLPATLARLSTIPNCRYVKESTLEVTRVRDIIALCGDRMAVFAGVLGYESAWLGAIGWVAVCSNVAPRSRRRCSTPPPSRPTGRSRWRSTAASRRCCPGSAARATSPAPRPPSG